MRDPIAVLYAYETRAASIVNARSQESIGLSVINAPTRTSIPGGKKGGEINTCQRHRQAIWFYIPFAYDIIVSTGLAGLLLGSPLAFGGMIQVDRERYTRKLLHD